ncbi:hypothetical protein CJ20_055 [Escherichia phage CJ20]|nr:hypothetical protein CJ20_055 [Escherichia phage CJ20]
MLTITQDKFFTNCNVFKKFHCLTPFQITSTTDFKPLSWICVNTSAAIQSWKPIIAMAPMKIRIIIATINLNIKSKRRLDF